MKLYKFAALVLISILIIACGGAPSEETLSEEDVILTFSVGTIVASIFETQTALATPTAASTSTLILTIVVP